MLRRWIDGIKRTFLVDRKEELILCFTFVHMGLILLMPPQTFPTATAFNIMDKIAGEHIWGAVFVVFGLLLGAARVDLFSNKAARRLLMATEIISAFLGSLVFMSNNVAIAPAYFVVLAWLAHYAYTDRRIKEVWTRA